MERSTLLRAAEALMIAEAGNLIRSSMLALFVFATFDSPLIAGDQWADSCIDVKQLAKLHPDQLGAITLDWLRR